MPTIEVTPSDRGVVTTPPRHTCELGVPNMPEYSNGANTHIFLSMTTLSQQYMRSVYSSYNKPYLRRRKYAGY